MLNSWVMKKFTHLYINGCLLKILCNNNMSSVKSIEKSTYKAAEIDCIRGRILTE